MRWLKSVLVGLMAAAVGLFFYKILILTGLAPFNLTPLAAYIRRLGFELTGASGVYLIYGVFCSLLLVWIFQTNVTPTKGVSLALFLWLIKGFVYAPYIGWGFFGFTGTPGLEDGSVLYLKPGPWFLLITLGYYMIYGYLVGLLASLWITSDEDVAGQIRQHKEV